MVGPPTNSLLDACIANAALLELRERVLLLVGPWFPPGRRVEHPAVVKLSSVTSDRLLERLLSGPSRLAAAVTLTVHGWRAAQGTALSLIARRGRAPLPGKLQREGVPEHSLTTISDEVVRVPDDARLVHLQFGLCWAAQCATSTWVLSCDVTPLAPHSAGRPPGP